MRVHLRALPILAAFAILASACQQQPLSELREAAPLCEVSQDDHAVFAAVLDGLARDKEEEHSLKGKELVILARTEPPLDGKWDFSSKSNPSPSHETVADFRAKIGQSCSVRGTLDTMQPSRLLSVEEAAALFKPPDPWGTFYKRFPNATGIIAFTQPGYDRARTEALVALSHTCGGLCGTGRLYLLHKVSGRWVVQNAVEVWIS